MAFAWTVIGVLLVATNVLSHPTQTEHMVVSKMHMSDLETSASGYSYEQRHGVPVSFYQYTDHRGEIQPPTHTVQYLTTGPLPLPLHTGAPYAQQPHFSKNVVSPLHSGYVLELPQKEALAPYFIPDPVVDKKQNYEDDHVDDVHIDLRDHHGYDHDEHHGHHHHRDYDEEDRDYVTGGGKNYDEDHHLEHGEKGEKGYEGHHVYEHGDDEDHEKNHEEGHYDEEGGEEKHHELSDGHYDVHDESEKSEEGGSHGNNAYHKKGHKTTGFHNVYHKDEYKKTTDFYDEDHIGGHYEKHGSYDQHNAAEEGALLKGGKHDSGYFATNHGSKGEFAKGHDYNHLKGLEAVEGGDSYIDEHSDYANKGGRSYGKGYGYGRIYR